MDGYSESQYRLQIRVTAHWWNHVLEGLSKLVKSKRSNKNMYHMLPRLQGSCHQTNPT